MVRIVEDFLLWRIRLLLFDVKIVKEVVFLVVLIMVKIFEKDKKWVENEILFFIKFIDKYIIY